MTENNNIFPNHFLRRQETDAIIQKLEGKGPNIIFVSGTAGIGKTTLLKYVSYEEKAISRYRKVVWLDRNNDFQSIIMNPGKILGPKTLIIIDDLDEWTSKATTSIIRLIDFFFANGKGHLLASARFVPKWWKWVDKTFHFRLSTLNHEESSRLLHIFAHLEAPDISEDKIMKIEMLIREKEPQLLGNPLFLKMLVKGTIENDLQKGISSGQFVKALLEKTFSRLNRNQIEVLRALSLFHIPTEPEKVKYLVDKPIQEIEETLVCLSEIGWVIKIDGKYQLAHKMVADFLYEKTQKYPISPPEGKLFLTFDMSVFSSKDVGEIIGAIEEIYRKMGGSKLSIDWAGSPVESHERQDHE